MTCPKPVEDSKVGLVDWLVQSVELSKDSGFVNYPIHQTAVMMLHHRTKVTRTISIMELLLIERMLTSINDSRPILQPGIIDEKNQSTSPKGKGERTESEQEKVTVAIVNVANHRPMYTSEKLLHFETSMNSHLKAERNIEQIRRNGTPMKGFIGLKRKLPSEKRSIKFPYQSLEGARFRDKFPSLNVIQTGSKNGRSPHAPHDQRCTE